MSREPNKAEKFGNGMQKLGKNLTIYLTVPILGTVFFGWIGLGVSLVLVILYAIGNKKSVPVQQAKDSPADEITKYKELLDNGIISEEEFDGKKKELLGL